MIPVKQTIFASEDGKIKGNCMSACLASLFELDINEVPYFANMHKDEWVDEFYKFIIEKGYVCYGVTEDLDELKKYEGIDGYTMACGSSTRSHVINGHSVIYRYGEFVFDPHPSGEGLKGFEYAYMIEKMK